MTWQSEWVTRMDPTRGILVLLIENLRKSGCAMKQKHR